MNCNSFNQCKNQDRNLLSLTSNLDVNSFSLPFSDMVITRKKTASKNRTSAYLFYPPREAESCKSSIAGLSVYFPEWLCLQIVKSPIKTALNTQRKSYLTYVNNPEASIVSESGDSFSGPGMPLGSWHCFLTGNSSPENFLWDVEDSSPPASMRKMESASHKQILGAQSHWFWWAWLIHIHLGPILIGLQLSRTALSKSGEEIIIVLRKEIGKNGWGEDPIAGHIVSAVLGIISKIIWTRQWGFYGEA